MTWLHRAGLHVVLVGALLASSPLAWASKKKKPAPTDTTTAPAATSPSPPAKLDDPPETPVGPPLVVFPLALTEGHDADLAEAAYVAEEAVRRAKRQALVPLDDVLDPTAAQARKKATAEGLRQLTAAHNAYDQLDMEVSSELANKAIASLTKGDLTHTFAKVVDAYELRVAAFASDPKTLDQAKAELGNLLPIDPRGELSPNLFNPDVIALAEGMRQKVKAASSLTLKVITTPSAARVFVDGVFRGVSPYDVSGLAPGNHYVSIVAPGFHQVLKRVNPGPDPQLTVTLEPAERAADLKSLGTTLAGGFHAPSFEGPLSRAGSALSADQVLVVAIEAPQGQGARIFAERGATQTPALLDDLDHALPGSLTEQAKVVDALVTDAVTRDHVVASQRIAPIVATSSPGRGGGVRYAGIAVLGVGAIAAGVGAVFGIGAQNDQSAYRTTPQLNTAKSSSLSSDGNSHALLANVSFGTALVAAGAGALMVAFGGPHASPAEAPASELVDEKPTAAPAPAPVKSTPAAGKPASTPAPEKVPEKKAAPAPAAVPPPAAPAPAPAAPPPAAKPKDNPPPANPTATPAPAPGPTAPTGSPPPKKDLGEDIKD